MSICDLLIIFCDQLSNNNSPNLQSLEFDADAGQQAVLNEFIQHHVFIMMQDGKFFI